MKVFGEIAPVVVGMMVAGICAEPQAATGTDLSKSDNRTKAIALLDSLASGDRKVGEQVIDPTTYIQHNPDFPSGRDAILNALPDLQKAGTKVDVKRALVDGDFVALHSEYNLFGPKVGFDVFRFQHGKIVEHWDNLQETVTKTVSGRSLVDSPKKIEDRNKTAANKILVTAFVGDVAKAGSP